jgi:ankyrin repeat protein
MISKQRVFDLIKAKEYEQLKEDLIGKTIIGLLDNEDYGDVQPPLTAAAAMNDEWAVLILLKHGEDPNKRRLHQQPPLGYAAIWKNARMMKFLLDHGASYGRSAVTTMIWSTTVIGNLIDTPISFTDFEDTTVKRNECIDILVEAGLLKEFLKDVRLTAFTSYTAVVKLIEVGLKYWKYQNFMNNVGHYPREGVTAIFNAIAKRETLAFKAYNKFVDNLYIVWDEVNLN